MDLTLILTEDCNLRCKYCYIKNFAPNIMSAEMGIKAVRAALSSGPQSLAITFFGGEPLLEAPTLFQIMREARILEREFGIPITAKVPTNGLCLSDAIIDQAGELGVFISLSFDGLPEAHDGARLTLDGQGSFQEVQAALSRLVKRPYPFSVYSVVTPSNVQYLEASRRYLWEQGARILITALDYTAEWTEEALATFQSQIKKLAKLYRSELKRKRQDFHMEPFDSRISQWTRGGEQSSCAPGVTQVTVAPDGQIYGCIEFFYRREQALGTVSDWLHRESVKRFSQARAQKPDECEECAFEWRCNNTCACVNLRGSGELNRPPDSLCYTEQAAFLTIDDIAAQLFQEKIPGFILRQYSQSYHMLSGVEALLDRGDLTWPV